MSFPVDRYSCRKGIFLQKRPIDVMTNCIVFLHDLECLTKQVCLFDFKQTLIAISNSLLITKQTIL